MEIKYEIDRKDFWNLNKYAMIQIPVMRNTLLAISVIFLVFYIRLLINNKAEGFGFIIFSLIFTSLFVFIAFKLLKWITMSLPAKKPGILGEHIIEISEKGLRERTVVNDSIHSWTGVLKILSDKKYIYIFIDNITAHLIPKRAFDSNNEADEFFNAVISLWKQYR